MMTSPGVKWPRAFAQTAEGISLHYVDVGPREALPVVLVHGWPDLWFGWRHQIEALQSQYRLIVPDLRGFGQSSRPQNVEAYGAKNVTNDLAALLDFLKIEKAVFIGHDWGGAMESDVWRMCLYHPERVIAVCGVCTAYTPPAKKLLPLDQVVAKVPFFAYQKLLADAENTGKLLDSAPRRFLTAVFRKHSEMSPTLEDKKTPIIGTIQGVTSSKDAIFTQLSTIISEEEMQFYVDEYSRSKFQSSCQYYATRAIDFENEQNLPAIINHPAMFIAAADDHVLKPELARKMARFLPNLETHVVDDAGHWLLWEQTDRVNSLLKKWLAKIPVPSRSKL